MLILRQGMVHAMTGQAPGRADVLIQGGRIAQVALHADPAAFVREGEQVREMDLSGCHVTPGLVDVHVRCFAPGPSRAELWRMAARAGMTAALACPDEDGAPCVLLQGERPLHSRSIVHLNLKRLSEDELLTRLTHAAEANEALLAEVYSPMQLEALLRCQQKTHAQLLLANLCGCEKLAEEAARASSGVVLGASPVRGQESAYALAARLSQAGAAVALTTDYPSVRMHQLTLCAKLCMQSGMPREQALSAITSTPAKLLGVAPETGAIEAGKYADLTVFDGDPMQLSSEVVMTLQGGKMLLGSD